MSFEARYRSDCVECDEPIRPGDTIEYDELDYPRHVECPTRHQDTFNACPVCNCDPCWCSL